MPLCLASLNAANFAAWVNKENQTSSQRRENPSLAPFVSGVYDLLRDGNGLFR
jgi:hypothetical protein